MNDKTIHTTIPPLADEIARELAPDIFRDVDELTATDPQSLADEIQQKTDAAGAVYEPVFFTEAAIEATKLIEAKVAEGRAFFEQVLAKLTA